MRKAAILILVAVLTGGCGSVHPKRYFQIRTIGTDEPALPRVGRRVCVEPAGVDAPYDDTRILYRVAPYELKYYPYEFWVDRPGRQVAAAMAEFLTKMKVFPVVVADRTKGEPEIFLRSRLHALEEIDGADIWEGGWPWTSNSWTPRRGRPSSAGASTGRRRCSSTRSASCRRSSSRILDEELRKAVWELARALDKK